MKYEGKKDALLAQIIKTTNPRCLLPPIIQGTDRRRGQKSRTSQLRVAQLGQICIDNSCMQSGTGSYYLSFELIKAYKSMNERTPHDLQLGWIGFHEEGREAFHALHDRGYNIKGVVTLESENLHQRSGWFDYSKICSRNEIPLLRARNINEPEVISWLRSLDIDVLLVIGWSQILKSELLMTPRICTIGAHASLLPCMRGSAPVNWAIIHGLKRTGNSLIRLTEQVDEGRVLDQEAFDIMPFDTCKTLYDKVACTNKDMLLRVLPKLAAGDMPGFDQLGTAGSNLPKRRPEDGRIFWNENARTIYDLVRGVTEPYPGAFFYLNGEKIIVWRACLLPGGFRECGMAVGPAFAPDPQACGQVVTCGDGGGLLLLEIEFTNGTRLTGFELAELDWSRSILE